MIETSNGLPVHGCVNGLAYANRWSQELSWFHVSFDDGRWTLSPQVERMHGYYAGMLSPGTALMLSHVHPDDNRRVAAALNKVRHTCQTLCSRHRIVDTRGRVYEVVMIGAPFHDSQGAPAGIHGFFLDVTTVRAGRRAKQLRAIAASGSVDEERRRVRAATRC